MTSKLCGESRALRSVLPLLLRNNHAEGYALQCFHHIGTEPTIPGSFPVLDSSELLLLHVLLVLKHDLQCSFSQGLYCRRSKFASINIFSE